MKGYIYKITNLLDWKCYIGQTVRSPEIRWKQHLQDASGKGHCFKLYNAFKKYDLCYFQFDVIAEVDRYSEEEVFEILDSLEKYYITYYDSIRWGYNIEEGGKGHSTRKYLFLETDEDGNLLEVWKGSENITAANYKYYPKERTCPQYIKVTEDWQQQIINDTIWNTD